MSNTKLGGIKTRETNYAKYGQDFYKKIGSKGGKAKTSKPKGFAARPDLARTWGAIGGAKSKRKPKKSVDIKA